jgi:hypothetical protein
VGLPDFKCNTASNDSISTDGREAERGDIWREVTELWMDFIRFSFLQKHCITYRGM